MNKPEAVLQKVLIKFSRPYDATSGKTAPIRSADPDPGKNINADPDP